MGVLVATHIWNSSANAQLIQYDPSEETRIRWRTCTQLLGQAKIRGCWLLSGLSDYEK